MYYTDESTALIACFADSFHRGNVARFFFPKLRHNNANPDVYLFYVKIISDTHEPYQIGVIINSLYLRNNNKIGRYVSTRDV